MIHKYFQVEISKQTIVGRMNTKTHEIEILAKSSEWMSVTRWLDYMGITYIGEGNLK